MTDPAPASAPEGQAPGQGNGAATPWYKSEGFSPEIQGYVENKGWNDSPLKAITAYQNLEKFQGVPAEQLIKLPKDMNDAESMSAIYARLGRPEKAEGYKFDPIQDIEIPADDLKEVSSLAHKLGLNNRQANELVREIATKTAAENAEAAKRIEMEQTAQMNEVKKEWGDKFEERAELARRAVKTALPAGLDEAGKEQTLTAIEKAIGTANFLKMFANFGEKVGEDKIPQSDSTQRFGYTAEQAAADQKQLMAELQTDPMRLKAFNENKGPDVEKMNRLNKIIAGASA